ncbi:DUF5343 domain-containing protein [Rhizobacter sp. Root404]|uniref:DUF5343 domain-containing protein n=1 Tax=Rhizobacter sp. Root404 TaxID=1736528 RepID=UPI000A555FB6|nr:DUF5343 domain-containing protein [Rhizobacter sp. Root404]
MPAHLPYLYRPGSLKTILDRLRTAATPDRVTGDFVNGALNLKGGTGSAVIPYLKKIGFVASDGTPTDIYKSFRNPSKGGAAAAAAVLNGYRPLAQVNETFYKLQDQELRNLIFQVTGAASDNSAAKLTFSTLKVLLSYAQFDGTPVADAPRTDEAESLEGLRQIVNPTRPHDGPQESGESKSVATRVGLNLSYTINLNLPATSDVAVFNAIFRSLKEHLLSDND